MTLTSTPTLLSLIGLALCLSICALCVALRTSARSLLKRLSAHSTRLTEAEQELDDHRSELMSALNRERARANMASLRAKAKATERAEPEASANGSAAMTEAEKDAWQRDMNLKLLTGQVKLPGRR